jgi:hypothetical protein
MLWGPNASSKRIPLRLRDSGALQNHGAVEQARWSRISGAPVQVFRDYGKRLGVSYTTILRVHQDWSAAAKQEAAQLAMDSVTRGESGEPGLPSSEPACDEVESDEP